jgi:Ca2+-dependent lipid-binding protein
MVESKGVMKVTVKEANLNRDVATFSKMDPYFILKVGAVDNHKSQTHKDGDKHPIWNESFTLKSCNPSDILEIKIMDNNGILNDDDVGRCQIKLSQLMHGGGITEWFVLLWKNKKAGEILLQSEWSGPR